MSHLIKKILLLLLASFLTVDLAAGGVLALVQEEEMTKNANQRLLPKSILDQERENPCENGVKVFGRCVGETEAGRLAHETELFQPVIVPKDKVVNKTSCSNFFGCLLDSVIDIFRNAVNPQTEAEKTGSLNAFRPQNLSFSINAPEEETGGENKLKGRVEDAYYFTEKMLLPRSVSGRLIKEASPSAVPSPVVSDVPAVPSPYPTPSVFLPLPSISSPNLLLDPAGSENLKKLISEVGQYYGVPPAVIAAVSWIEGHHVWSYSDDKILEYSREGAKDPVNCNENSSGAAGPMQFIASTWEGYQYAITKVPGFETRKPERCNILDSFYAAGSKLKNNSATAKEITIWNKQAVAKAGRAYYGTCFQCGLRKDEDLNIGSFGPHSVMACLRLGMSYCEYLWKYYQCNENSSNAVEFSSCVAAQGLTRIR